VPTVSRVVARRDGSLAVKRLRWNSLRVGDKVLVHDPVDPVRVLQPGTVAIVDTMRTSNDIGVRVTFDGQGSRVIRPLRLTVHVDPRDMTEPCWRCDERDALGALGRDMAASGVAGP
jgi:hypothetical protein